MRLYTVEVSYEMVVYADNENDACAVARDHAREGFGDLSTYDLDMNVRKYPEQGVPFGYDDQCCAYGSDKTIGEIKNVA